MFRLLLLWRNCENIHAENAALQEILSQLELVGVLVRRGNGRVRPREAMRVYESADVAEVARMRPRHVAIGALLRSWRIVERPCTLARYAAGLPVVVLIESANPAIVIHRHIEMDFVATGAEFRRLVTHERLEEDAAMGLRIQLHQEIVQRTHYRVLAGSEFVQLGVFEIKISLTHGAFHVGNRVAHHAAESSLGLGAMHNLLDWRVH